MHRPVSSVYGEIKRMLLTYPTPDPKAKDIVLQRYAGIFKALGNDVEYTILAHPESHSSIIKTIEGAGLSSARNLRLVPAYDNEKWDVLEYAEWEEAGHYVLRADYRGSYHTIWAQDAYSILANEDNNPIFLESLNFDRDGDDDVAEHVSMATGAQIKHTKYHIEGGNVLAGDDYLIVGLDYLDDNMYLHRESEEQVIEGFKEAYGVSKIIFSGLSKSVRYAKSNFHVHQGRYQPIFHIDMYMTLGGEQPNGKELILIGDLEMAKSKLGESLDDHKYFKFIQEDLDEIAQWFTDFSDGDFSFEVHRIPLDLWVEKNTPHKGTFLTYNNCLVETYDGKKRAYIPEYGQVAPGSKNRKKLDKYVKLLLEKPEIGFEVKQLKGAYAELCKRGGSVHCITKVLQRD